MKKMMIALMAVLITVALAGIGTYAYFNDTETSANTLTAGTLQLVVNDNGSSGTFDMNFGTVGNMAPGDITPWVLVWVKNSGNIDAATFGTFTLADASTPDLSKMLKLWDYRVEYLKADGTPNTRWATSGGYFGTQANEDWFIKDGDTSKWTAVGGKTNLYDWVNGDGPLDVPGIAWDMEGVKAGGSYLLQFRLQMDPTADNTYQGQTVKVGYQVQATQLSTAAILSLNLGGQLNDSTYVNPNVTPYLTNMIPQYN